MNFSNITIIIFVLLILALMGGPGRPPQSSARLPENDNACEEYSATMLCNEYLGPVKQWGYLVRDLDSSMKTFTGQLGIGPWWGFRNVPVNAAFGGKETSIHLSVAMAYHQGTQIELVQHMEPELSPNRDFYLNSDDALMFKELGYMVSDVQASVRQCEKRGMHEVGRIIPAPGADCVYMSSPGMKGMVIELIPSDQAAHDHFNKCLAEAADWAGSDPYRLISL